MIDACNTFLVNFLWNDVKSYNGNDLRITTSIIFLNLLVKYVLTLPTYTLRRAFSFNNEQQMIIFLRAYELYIGW